jgi:selenocysteine lyase/cysteine desulfurase
MVNLNNGGVCPWPSSVQEAMKRYLDHANTAPAYVLWRLQEPQKETVRTGLARLFGCDREEVAITRNASESLENVQLGLDLARGDEVLTTNQDYPRMLTTWKQRVRRDGIVLRQFSIPTPCEDPAAIVRLFEQNITPRTRVIHMCHVINLTGQVLPVKSVVSMARTKGIPVIVDGAHSFGHIAFSHADLDCHYFGSSLHKFLFAPHGTGMLYVRKDKIPGIWPLMPAQETQDADIRKFEEIGTHPAANILAIADALTFHAAIGPALRRGALPPRPLGTTALRRTDSASHTSPLRDSRPASRPSRSRESTPRSSPGTCGTRSASSSSPSNIPSSGIRVSPPCTRLERWTASDAMERVAGPAFPAGVDPARRHRYLRRRPLPGPDATPARLCAALVGLTESPRSRCTRSAAPMDGPGPPRSPRRFARPELRPAPRGPPALASVQEAAA